MGKKVKFQVGKREKKIRQLFQVDLIGKVDKLKSCERALWYYTNFPSLLVFYIYIPFYNQS